MCAASLWTSLGDSHVKCRYSAVGRSSPLRLTSLLPVRGISGRDLGLLGFGVMSAHFQRTSTLPAKEPALGRDTRACGTDEFSFGAPIEVRKYNLWRRKCAMLQQRLSGHLSISILLYDL